MMMPRMIQRFAMEVFAVVQSIWEGGFLVFRSN